MNTSNILEVKNISKVYHTIEGEIKALNNISFNINSGDFIGLIGPSGCGKSSILNIISNLDKNYKGNINIKNGIKVSYMLQEDALFPWLTVLDNALLGLRIKHKLTKDNKEYVVSLLKKYGLYAKTISIQLKDTSFKQITRSQTVQVPIQSVNELYPIIEELFDEHWEGQALRLIGVNTTNLVNTNKVTQQLNLFNYQSFASEEKLNQTIQQIKTKHGTHLIQKGIQKGQK